MIGIILIYGLIAGLISIGTVIASIAFSDTGTGSVWLGYLLMILALSLIFFGVKRYRDRDLGGVIRFVPALITGVLIAAVASLCYVVVWEAYLALTDYAFMTEYAQALIDERAAAGASADELAAEIEAMEQLKLQYADPLFRLPVTFSEIFPVGLIIALITAAILRNPGAVPARS